MPSSKIPDEFALKSIQFTTLASSHRHIQRVKVGLGEQWVFLGTGGKTLAGIFRIPRFLTKRVS
jgi:hypothetical protein